jgi:hypothetical protein
MLRSFGEYNSYLLVYFRHGRTAEKRGRSLVFEQGHAYLQLLNLRAQGPNLLDQGSQFRRHVFGRFVPFGGHC